MPITKKGWKLVHKKDGTPVEPGTYKDFRDTEWQITDGEPPRHAASSGRVYGASFEFFPDVFDMKWVQA